MSGYLPATAGRELTIADGSQVHGAVTAATRAAATAGPAAGDTARCRLPATEPATNLVERARGGRLLVTVSGPGAEPGILGAGSPHRSCPFGSAGREPPATVVVRTDGAGSRRSAADHPGAGRHHPAVLAALVWRDAVRGTDAAGAVVLRTQADEDVRWTR